MAGVAVDKIRLFEFCRRNHVRWLAFLGSVVRDDFRHDSHVNVLVDFDPEHIPGLLDLAHIERELSALLG